MSKRSSVVRPRTPARSTVLRAAVAVAAALAVAAAPGASFAAGAPAPPAPHPHLLTRGITQLGLQAVACPSATSCVAVGSAAASAGTGAALAEVWNGKRWKSEAVPAAAGAVDAFLLAVACPTATACTAVGYYDKSSGLAYPLAAAWNGRTWSLRSMPDPSGSPQTYFSGIACSSATSCVAVGNDENGRYVPYSLAEGWDGKTWRLEKTPQVSGASESFLSGVACPSPKDCVAVGYDVDQQGAEVALADTWNGSRWTAASAATPAGASSTTLFGIACSSATRCIATADYTPSKAGTSSVLTAAETWNGKRWTVAPIAEPAGAKAADLYGVTCTSTTSCTAVGEEATSSSVEVTLAESWNGSRWTTQSTPVPAGSKGADLVGISCSSSRACTAAGAAARSAGDDAPVVESWNGGSWTLGSAPA